MAPIAPINPFTSPRRALPAPILSGQLGPPGGPIYTQLPSNIQGFTNKYQALAPVLAALPVDVRNALISLDAKRVATGGRALTKEQTLKAVVTVIRNTPVTPPPERSPTNVIGNIFRDAKDIIASVPRLPVALVELAKDPSQWINLVPGTYVGRTLGEEGIKGVVSHPLMSALDVLPIVGKAASATRVGRAAALEAIETGSRARPLAALATRRLSPAGELIPRALTRATRDVALRTRPGQALTFALGNRQAFRQLDMARATVTAQTLGWMDEGTDIERATRSAARLNKDFPEFDTPHIARLTRRMQLDDLKGMSTRELAYVTRASDLATRFGNHAVSVGDLGTVFSRATMRDEFMPLNQAKRAEKLRASAERADELAFANTYVTNPVLDADTYLTGAREAIDAGMSMKQTRLRVRASIHALEATGHNVDTLKSLETKAHATGNWAPVRAELDNPLARQVIYSPDEIVQVLRSHRKDKLADRLAIAIADQPWSSRVTKTLNQLLERVGKTAIPELADEAFVRSVRSLRDRARFIEENLARYTTRRAESAASRFTKYAAKTPPARFAPLVAKETERRVVDLYRSRATTPAEAGRVAELVAQRRYHRLPGYDAGTFRKEVQTIGREVAATWEDMSRRGLNPTFVHTVKPDAVYFSGQVSEIPTTITQVKERTLDYTPGIQDASVALTHQGVEYLTRQQHEIAIEWITKKYGRAKPDLIDELGPRAKVASDIDPRLTFDSALEHEISRRYTKFDVDKAGYTWGSKRLDALRQSDIYIPNALARQLKALHNPRSPITALTDPVTKTFRVAVIGLSPRTHLYNILGNAVMVLGRSDPRVMKYMAEAYRMAKDPTLAPDSLKKLLGSTKRAFDDLDRPTKAAYLEHASKYMAGKSLGRIWRQVQESRITKAGGKLVDASYSFNSLMDDMYRSMAYLYARDKGLAKGMTREAADAAGLGLTRRVLMDYAGMTPFERATMRSVLPFYNFVSHAVKYVMSYPIDHPNRAFIMSKIADAELDDLNDTLPTRFLSSLLLGDPDAQGNQSALSLQALNPFGDVVDSMTMAGFLGNMNPLIATLLEAVGVERGEAELYPTLRYNPETGRLEGSHKNPIMAFVENVIPQTQILTGLMGWNGEFKERMRRDPDGARRQLISSVGIPILWRGVNMPQEQMKAEVARMAATADVRTDALKSGEWQNAMRYPTLRAYFEQIQQLPREVFQPLTPQPDTEQRLRDLAGKVLGQPTAGGNLARTAGGI